MDSQLQNPKGAELRRALNLPLLVLYGLGVTIGAGIYVLIGATAGRAGIHAPLSFVFASIVMAFSASSFAELAGRYPVSAGEAAYVRHGFDSQFLSLVTGILVVFAGTVSSAAIAIGASGYLMDFVALPRWLIVTCVILILGTIAIWGILESITFAGIFTLIEVAGLLAIVGAAVWLQPDMAARLPDIIPAPGDWAALSAVSSAGLLAFFAFIGFEDLVNLAEETKQPRQLMPRAIFLTLIITTLLYVAVVSVAVLSVPVDELAASNAPVRLIFEKITGTSPVYIVLIAVVATLNGVIVQIIMASRVLYGLGKQGSMPKVFARVSPLTRTPVFATVSVVMVVLALALAFPLEALSEATSRIVLTTFALINMSLFRLKMLDVPAPEGTFIVKSWVPIVGFFTCIAMLLSPYFAM